MGRINKEVEIISNIIESKKDLHYSSFSKFLEGAPILVTYYKQNEIESTTDRGLENVHSFLGEDSPIVYNKITNVPLFGVDKTQIEINEDESGLKPGFNTEGVLPPGLFKPIPNDYLIIDYMDKKILFKITEVVLDSIKSNGYFKIQFKFNRIQNDDTIDEQVTENFGVIYENIGTEDKAILKNEEIQELESLKLIYQNILDNYIETFYIKRFNSFLSELCFNETKSELVYDKYLTEFIINNNLVYNFAERGTIYLDIQTLRKNNFHSIYKRTLFNLMEKKDKKLLDKLIIRVEPKFINNIGSVFSGTKEKVYDMEYFDSNISINILEEEFIDRIRDCNFYEEDLENDIELDNASVYKNMIIAYLNESDDLDSFKFDILANIDYDDIIFNHEFYLLIPIILFIIKKLVNKILIKNQ